MHLRFFNSPWRDVTIGVLTALAVALPLHAFAQQRPKAATPVKAAPVKTTTLAVIRSVSHTPLPRGERISIEFSDEVTFASDRVPTPDRVYFDFKNSTVASAVAATTQALGLGPVVSSVRIARHSEQTTRLVLELSGHPRYSVFPLYGPFRLVIDVESDPIGTPAARPASDTTLRVADATPPVPQITASVPTSPIPDPPRADFVADVHTVRTSTPTAPTTATTSPSSVDSDTESPHVPIPVASFAPVTDLPSSRARTVTDDLPAALKTGTKSATLMAPPPATANMRGSYSLARQLGLGVSRIVIDPGHGGHDPGAQSNGINEADLVLDVALRLEKLLKDQPGIDVILTRRTDEFIPLEERTAIANRECADLFLSIHANASRESTAHGIETYFLNFATNPEAEAVAARENATSAKTMGNLPELVKTITLNTKVVESRELATLIQTSMVKRLRLQNKSVKDLGVKQAAFVVLIGAQMPSVLAEISFVTNKPEATLLKQNAYRQRIAQSLFEAVQKYQASLKKPTTMAAKDTH